MVAGRLDGAIIAAGRGERLRDAVGGVPKPLVEIGAETMLVRQARTLREAGAATVVALVNSESWRLIGEREVAIPDWMRIEVRDTASSMDSLFALGEYLGLDGADHFLLATVDAVAGTGELKRFVADAADLTRRGDGRGHFDGALAVVRWRGDRRPLFAEIAPDGAIVGLGERESAMVTAGFYWLPATIFDFAGRARAAGLGAMRRLLAMAVASGMRLAAIELESTIDVDELDDLRAARAMVEGPTRSEKRGRR